MVFRITIGDLKEENASLLEEILDRELPRFKTQLRRKMHEAVEEILAGLKVGLEKFAAEVREPGWNTVVVTVAIEDEPSSDAGK